MKTRRYRLGLRNAALSYTKPTTKAEYGALISSFLYSEFGSFNFNEGPYRTEYVQNRLKTIKEKLDLIVVFQCDSAAYQQLSNFKGRDVDIIAVDQKGELTEVFTNVHPIMTRKGENGKYYEIEISVTVLDEFGNLPHDTILIGGLS